MHGSTKEPLSFEDGLRRIKEVAQDKIANEDVLLWLSDGTAIPKDPVDRSVMESEIRLAVEDFLDRLLANVPRHVGLSHLKHEIVRVLQVESKGKWSFDLIDGKLTMPFHTKTGGLEIKLHVPVYKILAVAGVSAFVRSLVLQMLKGITSPYTDPQISANKLLDESFGFLNQIDSRNRVFYFLPLTEAGAKLRHPHEEDWCKELFRRALQLQKSWDRVALEMNAVVSLAAVNPNVAMELFWHIEEPVADAQGRYPEDVRATAAMTVFPRFFNAQLQWPGNGKDIKTRLQKVLEEIQRHAIHIARTGEYPYRGMGAIVEKLATRKNYESMINLIFSEAIQFYSGGKSKFSNRDWEFLVMLQTTIDTVSDRSLVHMAINQFVTNMQSTPLETGRSFQAEYRTAAGETIRFTDRNKGLLFRALPLIRRVEPERAKSITDEFPEFNKASDDMTYISSGFVEGNFNAQEAAAMHTKIRQISLLNVIQAKQWTDALQARQFANELTDSGLRLVGLSITLPGLARVDLLAAKRLYFDQLRLLQAIKDDAQRLQATIALAKAASAVKEESDFNSLVRQALELGTAVYKVDNRQIPELQAHLHEGYSELRDLVQFATAHSLNWAVDHIRLIQDIELRAHLLIFAAEGIKQATVGS